MTLAGKGGKAGAAAGTQAASHAPAALQVARAATAAAGRGPRGARHGRAGVDPRQARGVRGADEGRLNTIELDVKDEGGEIGFNPSGVALARKAGAVRDYYDPRKVAREMHRKGIYLIGRVVVFQDPYLARCPARHGDPRPRRLDLGDERRASSGSTRTTVACGTTPSRSQRLRPAAGFDEIMLDYVRFPSDGDVGAAVYPGGRASPRAA
jgi:hypothetical protein